MANQYSSAHIVIKILALFELVIFITWHLVWSTIKTPNIQFGNQNQKKIVNYDIDDHNLIDSVENTNRTKVLRNSESDGDGGMVYNYLEVDFTLSVIIFVGYIIFEIWLCWILYLAAKEKRKELCTQWLVCRVLLLAFFLAIIIAEVISKRCVHLPKLIYVGFRIFSIIAVSEYRRSLCRNELSLPAEKYGSKSPDKVKLAEDFCEF